MHFSVYLEWADNLGHNAELATNPLSPCEHSRVIAREVLFPNQPLDFGGLIIPYEIQYCFI